MGIYLDSGYLDYNWIISRDMPFIWIVGGRGTGKTYGALRFCLENGKKCMFMRRTSKQVELIKNEQYSPFSVVARDMGLEVVTVSNSNDLGAVYLAKKNDDGKITPSGAAIANICALSTVANIRGFDGSDIEVLIFDEFIKQPQEKSIKNEADAFANVYETINRNRELQGKPPLIAIMLSNSNELANDMFMQFGLVSKLLDMRKKGKNVSIMPEKGCLLIDVKESKISQQKAKTALYRLTGLDSGIAKMALDNEFSENDFSYIKSYKLSQFKSMATIGNICIYEPRADGYYYVSETLDKTAPRYDPTGAGKTRFTNLYRFLVTAYYRGLVRFENFACKALFCAIFEI